MAEEKGESKMICIGVRAAFLLRLAWVPLLLSFSVGAQEETSCINCHSHEELLAGESLAIASGYLAANTVNPGEQALSVLADHERNAWFVLGGLGISQFWKAWNQGRLSPVQEKFYAVLLAAVIGFTIYAAWLGGRLVYEFGVGAL